MLFYATDIIRSHLSRDAPVVEPEPMDTLLDRFCRYVQVETTADDNSKNAPSSPGQLDLGRLLVDELKQLKLEPVHMSPQGIVTATIPGNRPAPAIAWFAHMDTSPEASGRNVKPVVHRNYDGTDLVLPGADDRIIRVDETAELAALTGQTLITSDGTTLLGADDKCGVAVIMTAAARLMADRTIAHGPIRVCFTCDEEIGRGTDHIDLSALDCVAGYTLDGEGHGIIEAETFSADLATVTLRGYNIHPGLAKGKMTNAIRLAAAFIDRLPQRRLSPETTADREPFLHPYVLSGGVEQTEVRILLRSFDTADLGTQAELLRHIAATLTAEHPRANIRIDIKKQYRNMAEALSKHPHVVAKAQEAMARLNLDYRMEHIRGGTDGSRLTEKGLPTPNLSTGMHNFHSPLEFACLEEMQQAVDVLVELARCWASDPSAPAARPLA